MAFTAPTMATNNIASLDPEPNDIGGLTDVQLQALFDKFGADFKTYFISHLGELASIVNGSSGADNIGATAISGVSGATVQALLESIKSLVDTQLPLPDGSLHDIKLSNDAGDIKQRLATHLAETMSHLNGETGRKYKVVACVIRNDGTGWKQIDGAHAPINVSSITVDATYIIVNFGFTAKNVVSFVACPDEDFAGVYAFGSSVGVDKASIIIQRTPKIIGGYISFNGATWDYGNAEGVTNVTFGGGTIYITHNSIDGIIANANCRDGVYIVNPSGIGATTTNIIVRDYAGALVTTPDTNMRLYFNRINPSKNIGPNNLVSATGNIWCYGVMEVD